MKNLAVYVHGKGGNSNEAEHYKKFFPHDDVIGFDYKEQDFFEVKKDFQKFFDSCRKKYQSVILIANSIGAFFSMISLSEKQVDKAFFISPIVDMEKLICDMMIRSNVTENELREKKEIVTDFGENLSWKYLCYVRDNPIVWNVPTNILYGEKDNLTSMKTAVDFAEKIGATLTVMEGGEHWFHTKEQMNFLDNWLEKLNEGVFL